MPKRFYIIDGHAQIFRAFFAPFRDLRSPTGEPTKATFVFVQMLLNLIEQRKPDYLCMVIDSGDETVFRKEIYPEYKSNRPPIPDEFFPQEQRIIRLVKDVGVPLFAMQGYEADDLIATFAKRLKQDGFEVVLVSKDKDLRQLLDAQTRLYDVQSDEELDPAKMAEKLGYSPAQAIDVQTLMGDTVDNVPGIPGVGEKTAVKLLNEYGSIAEILKNTARLTPKMRENFEKFGDRLEISRKLVTLKDDVPIEFDPQSCRYSALNNEALARHLKECGFWSLLKKLGLENADAQPTKSSPAARKVEPVGQGGLFASHDVEASPTEQPVDDLATGADGDYRLVNTAPLFDQFLGDLKLQNRFAFDTETDDLGAMKSNLIGMSFSWKHGTGWYLPVKGPPDATVLPLDQTLDALRPILENAEVKKVGHNIKYDLLTMKKAGVEVRGVQLDSMIAAFLLDASRMQYGIDSLAVKVLHFRKVPTSDLIGSGKKQISMARVDLERVARYASEDADIALRLADLFEQKLNELPEVRKLCDELETPLIDALVQMEFNGVAIDPDMLEQQSQVLGERAQALHSQIMLAAGSEFNPDSPKQLAEVLFEKLKLPPVKKTKTGYSTDVEVLEKLSDVHPVPKLILEYRSLVKLKNTYLDNLPLEINPQTNRIHASFSQIGAATGRLSCSDPNLQNIPIRTDEGRRIRLAFVPGDRAKNVLVTADYSQIELRVLAHFTEEPALIKAFKLDEDIHAAVAAEVFHVPLDQVTKEQRSRAKVINFGIIYGITAFGLSRRIEGLTKEGAQKLIDDYNARFPTIQRFMQKCVMDAQANGFVETILGRRRPLPDIRSAVISLRNGAERAAINSVVQGSAADLIKVAMLNLHRRLARENCRSRMLLQVHDELVFETPESVVKTESKIIVEEMQNAMKLKVPLKVDVGWGKNWEEGK